LKKEYTYLGIFCALFATIIYFAVDYIEEGSFPYTTSMLAGFLGMQIATTTNVKTTYLCNGTQETNFDPEHALNAGF
jgi:Na+/H+-translocating membrane pyrophosphatase